MLPLLGARFGCAAALCGCASGLQPRFDLRPSAALVRVCSLACASGCLRTWAASFTLYST
eukprot:5077933-Pleurochrysis_carterae.AAC.1